MVAFAVFILCFGATLCSETVKYAAIIYRHGDRTPTDTYPTDPWRNESLWPVKFGELTNIGKSQHYALGKWLRQRYSHLLSPQFDPTEIYVRSTDVDRTLMSAQANLAGLYPPTGKSIWDKDLMWQPIPVHTVPEREDELLAMKKPCLAFDKEKEKYIHSKAYVEKLKSYAPLMNYLSKNTGLKIRSYYDVVDIYSILYIEQLYNFTLPEWTKSVFPVKMADPAGYSFTEFTATPLMARLKIGPIMKEIVTNMFTVMSEKRSKNLRVSMYSGHDLTVGSILNGLGLFDGVCPVYTSTVFIELLYENTTKTHSVMISYRNSSDIVEPYVLNIPHCGEKCPVSKFVKLYEHLLSVNWEYECNKQFPPLLGMSFFIGLGLFVIIYVAHKMHFARVTRQYGLNSGYANVETVTVAPTKPDD
ncbi:prostatic acid phosphatase [Ostrinia furnacalis]|uniref:prostatic acid phosphatase n=1 Tax=Ostrinia furnacalis TaxID=93504 RepID=UPI00103AE5E9|nr:prostatic acid phosphatase [Ostrinia furnacalis]